MRQKDVPCAGVCGEMVWQGKGCLPPGRAMCHPCRRTRRGSSQMTNCASCGRAFEAARTKRGYRKTCSSSCRMAAVRAGLVAQERELRDHPCPRCLRPVWGLHARRLCEGCKAERTRFHDRVKNTRRRGASHPESLSLEEIGHRDGWRCHLCGRSVDRLLRSPHPRSATVDHLVPVSADGDDAPENTRLAHRNCNVRRGAGGTVQLLLVG